MNAVWGDFESMVLRYIKGVAARDPEVEVLFCKTLEPVYGTCSYKELAKMHALSGIGMYRPVCTMGPEELLALLTARYADLVKEVSGASDQADVSAGE